MKTPQSLLILKQACDKFGFSWKLLDHYSNNLVEVTDGKKSFFSSNIKLGIYPLNLKFSAELITDKAWCYKILKQKGYRIPKGDYFFLNEKYRDQRGKGKELDDAFRFAKNLGYPVFVKPNNRSMGILAEIIYNKKELASHLQAISEITKAAIIQKVISLPEYRIFALNGEIEFVYQRIPPKIIGDGKTSIKEFIKKINRNLKIEHNRISTNSPFLNKQLKKHRLSFDSILKTGQEIQIFLKSNISSGGKIENYSETVSAATKNWVKRLMHDLQLQICGIDVFVKNSINSPDGFTVIEINRSPNLAGIYTLGRQAKALEIWGKILKEYFGKNKTKE